MKLTDKFSTYNFFLYWMVLSLCFVCSSCSSKSDEPKKGEEPSSSEIKTLESKKAISQNSDIEGGLKQENYEPKKVVAEMLILKEEVKRLKQENDALKIAIAKATNGKEQDISYYTHKGKDELKVKDFVAKLNSATSVEDKVALIESLNDLASLEDPSVIDMVRKALDDPNLEVGRAAIELMEEYESPEILPVIEKALNSKDEQTRKTALGPLANIDDPEVIGLLGKALNDSSKDIRSSALEITEEHEDPIKLGVMQQGIASKYDDVKYPVASMLEDRGDHPAVDILIEGLKDTNSSFREEINETLNFLVDKEFENYEEAKKWWAENKNKYDDELFEIE